MDDLRKLNGTFAIDKAGKEAFVLISESRAGDKIRLRAADHEMYDLWLSPTQARYLARKLYGLARRIEKRQADA